MSNDGSRPGVREIVSGAVVGVAAWILGYLFTYALQGSQVKNSGAVRVVEAVTGEEIAWKVVGWLFYNAHLVDTNVDTSLFGTSAINFISQSEGNAWVLYLVPLLLLLAAGVLISRVTGGDTPQSGATAGLLVVPGYFVLSTVGVFLFEVSTDGASAAPDLLMAATLAGLVYPGLFGALGGAVGAAVFGTKPVADSTTTR